MQTDLSLRLITTNNLAREFLEKAQHAIEKYIDSSEYDVPLFASEMAMGRTRPLGKTKGITGHTPNDFIISDFLTSRIFSCRYLFLTHSKL
ncbi:MAG: hypothetical protein Q7U47_09030 [Paludibacter sp.]|nr:hypothetical protein [Paludibacter sp.]